jgi:hypothetical protein
MFNILFCKKYSGLDTKYINGRIEVIPRVSIKDEMRSIVTIKKNLLFSDRVKNWKIFVIII